MSIKEIRNQTNMTQKDFAEYFNIPQRTIENWEGGQRTPPEYVVELIKYKIEKERLAVLKDLGEFKLRETDEDEIFYVTVDGTYIFVTKQYPSYADVIGKIKVYHDGLYFGDVGDMYDWIENSIVDHLIETGVIVKNRETTLGETLWKWS